MSSNKNTCPVPFDQQPLNEYKSLENSLLFFWSTKKLNHFITYLLIIFISSLSLSLLGEVLLFGAKQFTVFRGFKIIFISTCILEIILIRLLLGWSYVLKRLLSPAIFYEESGWYDGQIWIKPAESLTQDRLLGIYQLTPLVDRIKYSLCLGCIFISIEILILFSVQK